MAKAKALKAGDKVTWGTSQGETHGEVVKKITGKAKVKGYTAEASKDDPQYEVKSDKSGEHAIHKPDALKKA